MRRRALWLTVAKAVAGFLLGLALWWGLTPAYGSAMAGGAEPLIRVFERPRVTRLRAENREVIVNRADFPPASPRPGIPADDLTFNFILLTTLFAAVRNTFSNRNVVSYLVACAILYVTHVFGLIAAVESIYALQLGPWSAANYGPFARNFWGAAAHFYRLVGVYAFAFIIWWLLQPQRGDEAEPAARQRGKKKRAR